MNADRQTTVAARLTAPAPGAIAVIGLAGPGTLEILNLAARRMKAEEPPRWLNNRPTVCRIVQAGVTIDDAVICFTDEATLPRAEINAHGGVRVVERVLMLLADLGASLVAPEDFPDALRSADPIERRIDGIIQRAESRRLVDWLLAQRTRLPEFMRGLHSLDESERRAFEARSAAALRLVNGLNVAIVGPPNAGKSTLANRLIGGDRVITSDTPGTTRDWISETALVDGWPVTLTDTAGIRETGCVIEREAIRRGGEQASGADLILVVVDGSQSTAEQMKQIEAIRARTADDRTMVVVQNKCDLQIGGELAGEGAVVCRVSAATGVGMAGLEQAICRILGLDQLDPALPTACFEMTEGAAS